MQFLRFVCRSPNRVIWPCICSGTRMRPIDVALSRSPKKRRSGRLWGLGRRPRDGTDDESDPARRIGGGGHGREADAVVEAVSGGAASGGGGDACGCGAGGAVSRGQRLHVGGAVAAGRYRGLGRRAASWSGTPPGRGGG